MWSFVGWERQWVWCKLPEAFGKDMVVIMKTCDTMCSNPDFQSQIVTSGK